MASNQISRPIDVEFEGSDDEILQVNRWHGVPNLLESGIYSDLTIICRGHEFKVHKNVVCTKSPVLAAQVEGPWLEAQTGMVRLEEFDAGTFERYLAYLYDGNYPCRKLAKDPEPEGACSEENRKLLVHVRVAAIADYFGTTDLLKQATSAYTTCLKLSYLSLAGFPQVVREVYRVLPPDNRTLKVPLRLRAAKYWDIISDDHDFKQGMSDCGDFLLDMLEEREYHHDFKRRHEVRQEQDVSEKRIASWRELAASTQRETEQLKQEVKSANQDMLAARSDLQKPKWRHADDVRDCTHRQTKAEEEAKDFRSRMQRAEADTASLKTNLKGTDRTVAHILDDMGDEYQRKTFEKLLGLYSGCCGDARGEALALKHGIGWVFRCRKCAKGFTVTGPHARRMTEVS